MICGLSAGCGHRVWWERLAAHLRTLRLTTRGLARGAACWIEALGEFPDGALPEGGDSVTVVRGKKSCGTTIFG